MQRVASAISMSIVGFCVGGISAALGTFWCYGIGSWIGAPLGCANGAHYGWRTPLRDSALIFFVYFALLAGGIRSCEGALSNIDNWPKLFVWALVLGPGGSYFSYWPVRLLSFSQRRFLAQVLCALITFATSIGLLWWLRAPRFRHRVLDVGIAAVLTHNRF